MLEAFSQIREVHSVFQEAEQVLKEDIGVPICIPDCGRCCIHNIPNAMTIEAIYAISVLTGTGRLDRVLSRVEGWLLDRHPFATIYEGMPHGFARPKLKEEWMAVSRSQCPLLDERTKACTIHDCRPFACRAYGVTRDNADICPRPLGREESLSTRRYIPADKLRGFITECRREWERKNRAWIIAGSFPTTLLRAGKPEKLQKYILDNQIASAKLIGIEYETSLMWQPQVDSLRAGLPADLVGAVGKRRVNYE